jgi:predicted Zn-ribbon and HTH transcriptional regulator
LCDYSGSVREVQAHISGSRDDIHSGLSGADFNGYFGKNSDGKEIEKRIKSTENGNGSSEESGSENGETESQSRNVNGNGLPEVRCKNCGREVKYPELMPYKARCPSCNKMIRERDAFENLEEKADERGKDELAEPVEV